MAMKKPAKKKDDAQTRAFKAGKKLTGMLGTPQEHRKRAGANRAAAAAAHEAAAAEAAERGEHSLAAMHHGDAAHNHESAAYAVERAEREE